MSLSGVLDDLDETLTQSSKVAASLGDEFLVYVLDMAILHVRKQAIHVNDNVERSPRRSPVRRVTSSKRASRKHPLVGMRSQHPQLNEAQS